jgi:hypothetical protein
VVSVITIQDPRDLVGIRGLGYLVHLDPLILDQQDSQEHKDPKDPKEIKDRQHQKD